MNRRRFLERFGVAAVAFRPDALEIVHLGMELEPEDLDEADTFAEAITAVVRQSGV